MAGGVARRDWQARALPWYRWNFLHPRASNPMSSLSGTTSGTDEAGEAGPLLPESDLLGPPAAAAGQKPTGLRPDVALLQKAQEGDRGAYGQIVLMYQDRLYNAVVRLVGDREEARELTQEAFTRGLEKIDSFRGDAGPYTWLFRIAVNLAISQLRKVQRQRVFSLDRPGPRLAGGNGRYAPHEQASSLIDRVAQNRSEPSPDQQVEGRERDQAVLTALGRLDAEYRAVLV